MKFARLLTMSATLSLFAVSACQTAPVTIHHASGCGDLIPAEWGKGVPSAALPGLTADRTDWQVFGVNQTAQLDKANGRTRDTIAIVKRCEARDQATAAKLSAPWWRQPFVRVPDS